MKLKERGITAKWFAQLLREEGKSEEEIKRAVRVFKKDNMQNWTEEQFACHQQVEAYLLSECEKIPDKKPTDKLRDVLPKEVFEKAFRLWCNLKYGHTSTEAALNERTPPRNV